MEYISIYTDIRVDSSSHFSLTTDFQQSGTVSTHAVCFVLISIKYRPLMTVQRCGSVNVRRMKVKLLNVEPG